MRTGFGPAVVRAARPSFFVHSRPQPRILYGRDHPNSRRLARRVGAAENLPPRALEAIALDAFRLGHLTHAELGELLGFETRYALDGFLKSNDVYSSYSTEDLEQDRRDLKCIGF